MGGGGGGGSVAVCSGSGSADGAEATTPSGLPAGAALAAGSRDSRGTGVDAIGSISLSGLRAADTGGCAPAGMAKPFLRKAVPNSLSFGILEWHPSHCMPYFLAKADMAEASAISHSDAATATRIRNVHQFTAIVPPLTANGPKAKP